MKKAIQIAYDDLFEVKCEYAANAGFDAIAANFDAAKRMSEEGWARASEDINKTLDKFKLDCVQSHLPYYDLRVSAEELDDNMERAILNSIRVSGEIGAPWCVWHPRTAKNDGYVSAKSFEINKRVISGYLDCAVKANTGIALENLPIFSDVIPIMPFYTSDYSDLCELMDSFDSEKVSICWDFGHANLMDFDQAQAIKYVGSRIQCTHVHNNFKHNDYHLTPDQGNINWAKVMAALNDIRYKGPLTLETHCAYKDAELLKSFACHNFACLEYLERLMKTKEI